MKSAVLETLDLDLTHNGVPAANSFFDILGKIKAKSSLVNFAVCFE